MKVIIDTSSLLALARYYLPFDTKSLLFDYIKSKFENGDLIIIDAVYRECQFNSKGLVLKNLNYLNDKDFQKSSKLPLKTKDLIPPSTRKFYNLLDNNFRTPISRRLNDAEFEERKREFLETADARMIILALNKQHNDEDIIIVTEESETANDHKDFKKIPSICKILNLKVMTLPELIENYSGIDLKFT